MSETKPAKKEQWILSPPPSGSACIYRVYLNKLDEKHDRILALINGKKADPAFILRACYAHDQLLEACRAVRALFMPRDGLPVDIEANYRRMVAKSPELAQVNAAIAKAEATP